MYGSLVAATVTLGATVLGASGAGAAAGWSRLPGSGLAGGTIQVASSSTTLCQWVQPANAATTDAASGAVTPGSTAPDAIGSAAATPSEGDVVYDGTEVRVRLSRDGIDIPLGRLPVALGGGWAGTVTIPDQDVIPGGYDLFVTCVVDRPELDGVRTYDFDPLPFTVTEGPPPTTVEVPTELVPPITAVNPVQVQGEQLTRPATAAPAATGNGTTATGVATLPKTGDGTLGIALAGIGSLLVGGAALWWGARHARRHPAELAD